MPKRTRFTYKDLAAILAPMTPQELNRPVTIYSDDLDEYYQLQMPHPTLVSMDGKNTLMLVIGYPEKQ